MSPAVRRQVPNAITVSRLILSLILFGVLAVYDSATPGRSLWVALGLFVVAAGTDFLDGMLARRWNVVSVFGRVIDPFCDKILILGTIIYLAGPAFFDDEFGQVTGITPSVVVVLLGREFLVTVLRSVVEGRGRSFAAEWSGKIKMGLQCALIIGGLLHAATYRELDASVAQAAGVALRILVWATVAITIYSGLDYCVRAGRILSTSNPSPAE